MANDVTELLVFLASPSDLADERAALRELATSVNTIFAPTRIRIRVVGWEEVPPNYGRPQAQINPRVEECDIFVGMLRRKWGTDTGEHSSGFFEEFSVALGRRAADGKSPVIALYFAELPTHEIADPGPQLTKVLEFKRKVESESLALYAAFGDAADLAMQVSVMITAHIVQEVLSKRAQPALTWMAGVDTSRSPSEYSDIKPALWSVLQKAVKAQDLNVTRVAAMSELCTRVLKEDPWEAAFVEELADIAAEGERKADRQGADGIAWAAMQRLLRDEAHTARQRRVE